MTPLVGSRFMTGIITSERYKHDNKKMTVWDENTRCVSKLTRSYQDNVSLSRKDGDPGEDKTVELETGKNQHFITTKL